MSVVGPYPARHPSPLRRLSKPSRPANAYPAPIIPPPPPDPFYGHRETAELCQRFIRALFACPDRPPPSTSSPQSPTPPLALFVAYALHRTRLHPSVTFTALFLLSRLKSRFPAARGSSGHRLFISAFMIASKVVCDDTYSNKSWTVVGQGMFSLREINQMEREMCGYLEWYLNVPPSDLHDFEARVRKEYAPGAPCPPFVHPPLPASTPSSTSTSANATSAAASATSSLSTASSSVGAAVDIPLPPSVASSSSEHVSASPEQPQPHSSHHHHNHHNHHQHLPSPPVSPRQRSAARAPTIPPAAPTLRPISVPGSASISTMVSAASTSSSSGGSNSGRPATPQLGPREDDSPSPASSTTCLTPQSDDDEPDDATIVSMGMHGELSAVADSSTAVGSSVGGGSAVASVVGVGSGPTRTSSALSFVSAASLPPKSKAGRDPSFAFPSRTVW